MLFGKRSDDLQHLLRELGVERRSGLVEEEDIRLKAKGACDSHALLLAARKLARIRILTAFKTHLLQKRTGKLFSLRLIFPLDDNGRFHHIAQHRIVREEIEILEHETEAFACFLGNILATIDRFARCVVFRNR